MRGRHTRFVWPGFSLLSAKGEYDQPAASAQQPLASMATDPLPIS